MSLNNLKSLLLELEQNIQAHLASVDPASGSFENKNIGDLFTRIYEGLNRATPNSSNSYHLVQTLIQTIPLAVAVLDKEMNYIAVSDRWMRDYKIETADIIGHNHYKVLSETPERWRREYEDCLAGKFEMSEQKEDFFVRENGWGDWLRWQLSSWRDRDGEISGLLISSEIVTERKLLQSKIQSTERQMRAVFTGMNEFVFTVEPNSDSILILPTKFFEIYDDSTIDRIIVQTQNLLFDSPEAKASQALIRRVLRQQRAIEFEYSLHLDDALIWFSVSIFPVSPSSVIWIAKDVTDRKEIEQDILYAEKELAQVTLQSIGEGVITTDAAGRVQYLNPVAEQITGWSLKEAEDRLLPEVFQLVDGATQKPIANPIARVSRRHKVCKLAAKNALLNRHGVRYEVEGLASPIMNRQEKLVGTAIIFRDVTVARRMARRLSWQASHDSLTKLYNRRKFEEYVAEALNDARLHESHHALCYIDLDCFKIVNDTCGHAAGDRLLQQVTILLTREIRQTDIIARLGGDEFGILFNRCPIEVAKDYANELRRTIEDFRFIWNEKVFRISISVGLVEIKSTTEDLTSLLSLVDAASYVAKEQGGNYVHLCHEQDLFITRQKRERQWVEKINRALEENRFRLYTQKIVPIEPDRVVNLDNIRASERHHHEILLRLQDESGIVPPGAFIPAAERYGLMPAIDRWVISTFLAGYEVYCQSVNNSSSGFYTINLSGASINNQEFGSFLRQQFDLYQVPPHSICFEITETVAITNLENANALISQLKNMGCSIALDDFGSGMSSLTYLKNLPIDYLKIDGSFITNIANDKVDYATVECFNHISQIMNIKTIAEFVENQSILQNLQQIGINYAQGYGIEKPKPLVWSR